MKITENTALLWLCSDRGRLIVRHLQFVGQAVARLFPAGVRQPNQQLVESGVAHVALDAVQQVNVPDSAVLHHPSDHPADVFAAVHWLGDEEQALFGARQPHAQQEEDVAAGDDD